MKNEVYIIGEIGQNHNGDIEIAKQLIEKFSTEPYDETFNTKLKRVNAIKFTKRDLKQELTDSAMNAPYKSIHSFGETYGQHREALELNDEQHFELYKYVKEKSLDYVITLTSPGCLSLLDKVRPDYLKVASRDLTHLPLLNSLGETKLPIILSTGMGDKKDLDNALTTITKYHNNISILHCCSQYPTTYSNVNLNSIKFLKREYPNYKIGYSDHTVGIATPLAAVALGAQIIEKHISLDRTMKGTDQAGSLEPIGFLKMVRDIRNLEKSFGVNDIFICKDVEKTKIKLARSIASIKKLEKGHIISEKDIHLLSPGDGFQWIKKGQVIGKTLSKSINKNEIIYKSFIE